MKRFLLALYLIGIVTYLGYAQNLTLSHSGVSVANNENVVFTGEPSTPVIEAHITVHNNGAAALNVMCKKTEISLVTGSVNTFCWDNCYPPNVYVSLGALSIAAAGTNDQFIGEYQPATHAGQSIIRYTFYNQADLNDSVCFNALFNAYPLGIEQPEMAASLSHPYPNPANLSATINYQAEGSGSACLMVRNVLGSTVEKIDINGSGQVSLNTSALAEGIYYCSLVVDGQIRATRKLIVSH